MTREGVRLACLRMVVEHGAELDKRDPLPKAQQFVDFVLAGAPAGEATGGEDRKVSAKPKGAKKSG